MRRRGETDAAIAATASRAAMRSGVASPAAL